jgi:hypothetical protein
MGEERAVATDVAFDGCYGADLHRGGVTGGGTMGRPEGLACQR